MILFLSAVGFVVVVLLITVGVGMSVGYIMDKLAFDESPYEKLDYRITIQESRFRSLQSKQHKERCRCRCTSTKE